MRASVKVGNTLVLQISAEPRPIAEKTAAPSTWNHMPMPASHWSSQQAYENLAVARKSREHIQASSHRGAVIKTNKLSANSFAST